MDSGRPRQHGAVDPGTFVDGHLGASHLAPHAGGARELQQRTGLYGKRRPAATHVTGNHQFGMPHHPAMDGGPLVEDQGTARGRDAAVDNAPHMDTGGREMAVQAGARGNHEGLGLHQPSREFVFSAWRSSRVKLDRSVQHGKRFRRPRLQRDRGHRGSR